MLSLSLYTYMYTCIYSCHFLCIHIRIHMYIYMYNQETLVCCHFLSFFVTFIALNVVRTLECWILYVYVFMCVCVCVCACVCVCVCSCAHVHTYLNMYTCVYVCVCMYVCMYVCMCARVYVCTCVCVCMVACLQFIIQGLSCGDVIVWVYNAGQKTKLRVTDISHSHVLHDSLAVPHTEGVWCVHAYLWSVDQWLIAHHNY